MAFQNNFELNVARFIVEKTNYSLFLTGGAGTGKSTFIKEIAQHTKKKHIILAPTGIAAINVGGMTIHSFFRFDFRPFLPGTLAKSNESIIHYNQSKKELINELDLIIIIDEVSMVRADLLDRIDYELREIRHSDIPFGGIQLLMIGDLRQLPPVVKIEDDHILKEAYQTNYFFGSKALEQIDYHVIELKTIYRQRDKYFQSILNRIRVNNITRADLAELNSRYLDHINPGTIDDYIRLVTHVSKAREINISEIDKIPAPAFCYEATITGDFPADHYPTERSLSLKVGAQVMFVRNDQLNGFINGTIGIVSYLDHDTVRVRIGAKDVVDLSPVVWESKKYTYNRESKKIMHEVIGTFKQYPLRLAWAITIHKSQGLTFDKVIIDARAAFSPGQAYVALSRCRTLDGIILSSTLNRRSFIIDTDIDYFLSSSPSVSRLAEMVGYEPFEYEENVPTPTCRPMTQVEIELVTALKQWRRSIAIEKNIKAYMVLPDKSIDCIARALPRNKDELMIIYGIRSRRIEEYGDAILAIVDHYRQNFDSQAPIKLQDKLSQRKIPTRQISYEMFKAGKSIADIAKERSLSEMTIQNHLIPYIKSGEIDISSLISPEVLDKVRDYCISNPENKALKPIFEFYQGRISYEELRFALAYLNRLS